MGLASNALDYPVFTWLDATAPLLVSSGAYLHWGYYVAPGGRPPPAAAAAAAAAAPAAAAADPRRLANASTC
jgi:hypothetical protein